MITLGQTETDNINRLITLTDAHFIAKNDENREIKIKIMALKNWITSTVVFIETYLLNTT